MFTGCEIHDPVATSTNPANRALLRWCDNCYRREIRAVTNRVLGDQSSILDLGMCANVEVRQGRAFRAATTAVSDERLGRRPACRVREGQPLKKSWIEPSVKVGNRCECRGQLGIDDRVDEDRPQGRSSAEFAAHPGPQFDHRFQITRLDDAATFRRVWSSHEARLSA
jgi:hypothetical protein